jgi:CRP-like cAMP-binding protein
VENLKTALRSIHPLSAVVEEIFLSVWQSFDVPKDHFLLRPGNTSDHIFFIEKGSARIFYSKKDKEITEWLALDNQLFLSITSFFQRTPSHLAIHTMEPSTGYRIHYNDLMRLSSQYHEVETHLRKMLTASLILSQVRMDSIQFESAQDRYYQLLQANPKIIQRVPLMYIASFLGVTLETLSRIRSGKSII